MRALPSLPPPYVLLDTRPGDAPARLYRDPVRVVVAEQVADVGPALTAIRAGVAEGLQAAGWLSYEAGAALVARTPEVAGTTPLLWFGLFESHDMLSNEEVTDLLPDPAGSWAGPPQPGVSRDDYDAALARVLALIEAGDVYQANLTFAAKVGVVGDPLALYARLRRTALAPYAALVDTGETTLLSLSPELFFALEDDALTCSPMKGTAKRGDTVEADRVAAQALASDAKQRAENLMIVDLMRNDLARVAVAGSVAVPELFSVETYPSIHQMTSTVTATLSAGRDAVDVIEALFPCGSITGAPKQRAMEVIAGVEARARGAYTGAIGRIDAKGARFNVAIRTLTVTADGATMGLGSGVVADSQPDDEWTECLAKGAFVTAGRRRVDLIETMAFDPEAGLLRLEAHLARMKASAEAFAIPFDRHAARNELQAATFRLRAAKRIRLLLAESGAVAIEVGAMPPVAAASVAVAIVPLPVAAADFRLRHKTSDRAFYDEARRSAGTAEVVFEHEGVLTEGSFTSLFVLRGDTLVTPPLIRGLLPGVLRADLIEQGRAIEGDLTRGDLASGFFVGNAVRGLMRAHVADANAPTL